MTRRLHWRILPNIQITYANTSQTLREDWSGRNTPEDILWHHCQQRQYYRRKLQADIFGEYRQKHFQQNISQLNLKAHKKGHKPRPSRIHSRFTRMVQHMQINQCDTPHQQKDKTHMIISMDAEKAFDKIQHSCMIKILMKMCIEWTHLIIVKAVMTNHSQYNTQSWKPSYQNLEQDKDACSHHFSLKNIGSH